MDLDAILARRPQLALVDELAHTNAPGSRHPKRYLDVEELLAAGIDVYTTLNIQHIESLNDVVAQITRVRVRETVPDSILDRADDIEVIDLTPDDLIQRLKEGKVYVPKQATRALEHYFSPGNLTALRELALRRTAQRVDEQLLTHMQAHAIPGPWAAGERILVCVSEDPRAAGLVRYAKRAGRPAARAVDGALRSRPGARFSCPTEERDRIADTLRLAEPLGGEAVTIPGGASASPTRSSPSRAANNVTQIVIGKSSRSRWFEIVNGSVVHDLVRRSGDISVHVIAGEDDRRRAGRRARRCARRTQPAPFDPAPYVVAALAVAAALGHWRLIRPMARHRERRPRLPDGDRRRRACATACWPSLFASVAASLCFNFFFLPPLYTFTIADPKTSPRFVLLHGRGGPRLQPRRPRPRPGADGVARAPDDRRRSMPSAASSPASARSTTCFGRPPFRSPRCSRCGSSCCCPRTARSRSGPAIRRRTCSTRPTSPPPNGPGRTTARPGAAPTRCRAPSGCSCRCAPAAAPIGVVGIDSDKPGPLLTPDERRLLDALTDQAALAIERVHLVEDIDRAKRSIETDRLRSALLTSISHDLQDAARLDPRRRRQR